MKKEKIKEEWDIPTCFGTNIYEFERYIGRKPTKREMEDWVHYLKKGMEAQLDWNMICDCASYNFKRRK